MPEIELALLRPEDVSAAQEVGHHSLREAGQRYGWTMGPNDESARLRGRARIEHCRAHDPEGAWVARSGDQVVGVTLATRRGPLWFLSLLTVAPEFQSAGVGRRLLEHALATFDGVGSLCASDDPKALRRYRLAGFDLHPAYQAEGALDRGLLPAVHDVRLGSYADDRDLLDAVDLEQRGASHGPDFDHYDTGGRPVFVTDSPAGRGYVVVGSSGPDLLAATTPEAAQRLLWTALAEHGEDKVEIEYLTAGQQWALDVALAARLTLRPTGSFARAGIKEPMSPYLPSGTFG